MFEIRSGNSLAILDRKSRAAGDRPDFLLDRPVDSINSGGDSGDGPWQYLNPAAFARVPFTAARYQERGGTTSRRGITGPGFWTADFNLAKRFRFDQFSFQLRAEVFNAFNFRNYGNPQVRFERSNFGQITSTRAPRIWQLGVRFDF